MVCLQCSRPGTHSIGGSPGFPPAPRLPALASRPPLGGREGPRARMRPGLLSPAQPGGSSRGLHLLPHCRGKKGSPACHLLRLRGQQPLRTLLRPHLAVPGAHEGVPKARRRRRARLAVKPTWALTPRAAWGSQSRRRCDPRPHHRLKGPGTLQGRDGWSFGVRRAHELGWGEGDRSILHPGSLWRQPLREPRVRPRLRSRRNGSPRAPWSLSRLKSPVSSVSLERREAQ